MTPGEPSCARPRVDVIVPCYCYGKYLRQCVESVLTQDVPARVLIIDDASPDGSGEVAEELSRADSRVTTIRHRANQGHVRTYNEGIEWLSADYMLLISADDYLLPGAFGRAVRLMDQAANVAFTFGRAVDRIDDGPDIRTAPIAEAAMTAVLNGAASRVLSGEEFIRVLIGTGTLNIVRTPTAIVRTAVQKRAGGYRPELPHSCDFEMWLRLAARGPVGVIGTPQAVYRVHRRNMHHGYAGDRQLTDLEQRRMAIDAAFTPAESSWARRPDLRRALLAGLASDAAAYADAAFDAGDSSVSTRMAGFALAANPRVRSTSRWWRLRTKQSIGLARSQRVSGWLARARRIV